MCMLCVIPPHTVPTRDRLENSALNNPHGFGFAIAIPSENRILVEHTMDADESINRFLEARSQYPEGYAMWHARLATHGTTDINNCHPFRVGKDNLTYLAHNGILPVIETDAYRSDTRVFAEDVLPAIGGVSVLDNEQAWNILEDFTSGSKVCVITLNPAAKQQMYLLHAGKGWHDESGVWWSNDGCKIAGTRTYDGYGYYTSTRDYDYWGYGSSKKTDATNNVLGYNEDGCNVCESYFVSKRLQLCSTCYACQKCFMLYDECKCTGAFMDERRESFRDEYYALKNEDKPKSIHAVPLSDTSQAWDF